MIKISPDEILLKHGKWISRLEFIELIIHERNVGKRQAYNIIKDFMRKSRRIKKHLFQDRTTMYGLEEFGPPSPIIINGTNFLKPKLMTSKWNILQKRLEKEGGYLLDLEHQKMKLGDRDPETGWPKENYDQVLPIQGIIVLKGATDLAAAIKIIIPEKYDAFIFTPSLVNEVIRPDDQIYWRDKRKLYKVKKIDKISDPYETSYVILKVVEIRII